MQVLARVALDHVGEEESTYSSSSWYAEGEESLHEGPILGDGEYLYGIIEGDGVEVSKHIPRGCG